METELLNHIPKLKNKRVLVLGDVMLDRFIYGAVDRISPEAPIPVFKIQREQMVLGGAGNVVRNICALGGQADLIGVLGQDQAGYDCSKLLSDVPDAVSLMLTLPERPTTRKTRYISSGQQMLRTDQETTEALTRDDEEQILSRAATALNDVDVVIVSDYAKGVCSPRIVAETIRMAREKNKPVLVDPKGRDYTRYRGATMLTPNRKELQEATHADAIKTVIDAEMAARVLLTAYNIDYVLAKMGGDGICLVPRDGKATHVRASTREVFDVTGAGDTVVATMALAMAAKLSLHDATALANTAGSLVVGKLGTATITLDEMANAIQKDAAIRTNTKLMDKNEAQQQCERWRKQGMKIGLTNGCFDILHAGHIASLRQARAACDKLVLALNSDLSIKRLKGPERPVQSEDVRAEVLGALSLVDLIVIFDDDTPLELIKTLRPQVLIKGADYTPEQVVGWPDVKSWGGELVLVPLVQGQSTTRTVEKLRNKGSATG
ncbi:MAG: D-glycero-beta-D-manno-heptose-7-phosphate kinase [Alphaproteobacteria bacterium]|nr:D-glycero-beta-D-manno-heptose-7-phosphate kinase [Alphaproteobacteria bacterium]